MRRPLFAANWKMHKLIGEAVSTVKELKLLLRDVADSDVVVCPPFTALQAVSQQTHGSNIHLGSQDLHWQRQGAYTGEVSAEMLWDAGCEYVIIGHSERRQYFHETDRMVHDKIEAALRVGLLPIICVGEDLTQREAGESLQVVRGQVEQALSGLTAAEISRMIVAYEPIWAIGTGRTATPEIAQEVHGEIRQLLRRHFGDPAGEAVRILYGGSVKGDNIGPLMMQPDIDGALVGGASLEAASFAAIVKYPGSPTKGEAHRGHR